MNLQGNSGHVDGYGKHAVRARVDSPMRCGTVRAVRMRRGGRASLKETVSASGNVPLVFSPNAASGGVSFPRTRYERREDEDYAEKTELRYNILAPAKRPSRDITTAMRTVLPAAHARDGIASCIRPTAGGDGDDKTDRRRKKSVADERTGNVRKRNEDRERERDKGGRSNGVALDGQILCDCQRWNAGDVVRHAGPRKKALESKIKID